MFERGGVKKTSRIATVETDSDKKPQRIKPSPT
jgi:hypothetical protein